jgi:hypothetical protein
MKNLFKDHLNFETKTNKVPKNEEERMKMNLQNFNVKKKMETSWKKWFFFCGNNYKKVDHKILQMMCCIICYTILSMHLISKLR